MPLAPMLFLVFLVLKLTDVIDWPWLWVTAPLWISALIVLAIMAAAAALVFFYREKL